MFDLALFQHAIAACQLPHGKRQTIQDARPSNGQTLKAAYLQAGAPDDCSAVVVRVQNCRV